MSAKLMRSVSVIAISVSLAMPAPVFAQAGAEAAGNAAVQTCADGSEPVTQEGSETPVCPDEAPAEAAADPAAAVAESEAAEAPAPESAAAESAAEDTQEAATEEAASGSTEDQGAETEAKEPSAQAEAQAQAETAPAEADTQAVAAPAEAEAEAEAAPAENTAAETATLPPVNAEPSGDAAAVEGEAGPAETDAATDETEAQQESEAAEADQPAAGTETPSADTSATETASESAAETSEEPTETAAETEPSAEQPAEAETTAEQEVGGEEETQQPAAEGSQQTDSAATDAPATEDQGPAEVTQDDTAQSTEEANTTVQTEAAAAAAEETTVDTSDADNVETVTEESARSSNEEFATTATAPAERDEGLSNFEKFALGALGVAAAATFLNQNEQVVVSSDDRLVVRDDNGNYRVLKNDDELLRRPGVQVATREFSDGSTRTIVTREDGSRVVTIRAPDGQVLKRTRILADGREVVLFDDTRDVEPVEMSFLEQFRPRDRTVDANDPDALRSALLELENPTDRSFSLQQVRQIRAVRDLVPEIDLDDVNFETGSAVIRPEEARDLSAIGEAIAASIEENPNEVFLIEGHTDAVGGAGMNLALSDRRAESAALALTEYFDIPPENLVVQGYGESNLKIRTNEAERENRRVAVRRITPLLYSQR